MTLFAMLTGTLPWAKPSPATKEFKYFLYRYKQGEKVTGRRLEYLLAPPGTFNRPVAYRLLGR
jgi:hypothetical protein